MANEVMGLWSSGLGCEPGKRVGVGPRYSLMARSRVRVTMLVYVYVHEGVCEGGNL